MVTPGDFDPMESSGFVTGETDPGVAGFDDGVIGIEDVDLDVVVVAAGFGVGVTCVCVALWVVGEAVEAVA